MTKPPNKVQGNESELYPNAWERFEHAVDVVIKSGPKHHQAPPLNQRNVQHLKGAFIKAGRELKLAIPFIRFKVPAIFIWAFIGWLPELAEGRRSLH